MKAPSFEGINYALRPAKNVERKMFCEAFGRLARIAPLPTYRYLGFGSIGFHDFSLFHQRFGIEDMVSIEARESAKKRVSFNRPYSCIRIEWGWSYKVLPLLTWPKRSIVWLDYEDQLDRAMLGDIRLVCSALRSGSMLIVTVRAEPLALTAGAEMHQQRLDGLIGQVGRERVPVTINGGDLSQWGTARVFRDIIHEEVRNTLADRNGPLPDDKRIKYSQLFNFHYADGAKMLTVGGMLLDRTDAAIIKGSFDDLDFVRAGRGVYKIETPMLTLRELRFLDSRLPRQPGRPLPAWLPSKQGRRYGKLYRHFPVYTEVEV